MVKQGYYDTHLMRRCSQLGISLQTAMESDYAKKHGWKLSTCRIKYRDGKKGTVGWGAKTRPITDGDITPHSRSEMLKLLGLSKK